MVKGKKGWIKIIEAYLAIMLFMGLIFVIVQGQTFDKKTTSIFENDQMQILKNIQSNETLRSEIIGVSILPVYSNSTLFPINLLNYFKEEAKGKNCLLKICETNNSCSLDVEIKGEIYLKSEIIFANQTTYSPKKISMICVEGTQLLSDYYYSCEDGLLNGNEFGVDCNLEGDGGSCDLCGVCTGTLKFECEKLKQESACRDRGYCNWTGSECERVECHEIVNIADCISGQGCYAIE